MGWIACSDQLPDSDLTVMTYDPNSKEPVWPGYHDGEQWWCITGLALPALSVTHWMPFPEPPALAEDAEWTRPTDFALSAFLLMASIKVDEATVAAWSDEQCQLAEEYAVAVHLNASDHDDVVIPPFPEFLKQYKP